MTNSIFLDTSFSIALAISRDENHATAVSLAKRIKNSPVQIVTTQAVILEIGNALSHRKYRATAAGIINRPNSDAKFSVIELNPDLIDQGFQLFVDRHDKDWSLVDCISFVVMRERGIEQALTSDGHFVQAGFRAFLREDNI